MKPTSLPGTGTDRQTPCWKHDLANAYRRPEALLSDLGLGAEWSGPAAEEFPLRVPRDYARRIRPGDPEDPLLRQVLPIREETLARPGYIQDPVGDASAVRAPGLLQKYHGRALLVVTGACALHCRYCFRRHFPYATETLNRDPGQRAIEAIARDPEITEVIVSGGDPLLQDDRHLARLIERLAGIPHVRRLRLHTRVPIALPSRITPSLCALLTGHRLSPLIVVQANHPHELGGGVPEALARLRQASLPVLNQSVLLRGVNDRAETLAQLSESLFDHGVLPYYLHLLDPVAGAWHFEVPPAGARALLETLRARLPGYLVPRMVREIAGGRFKYPFGEDMPLA